MTLDRCLIIMRNLKALLLFKRVGALPLCFPFLLEVSSLKIGIRAKGALSQLGEPGNCRKFIPNI